VVNGKALIQSNPAFGGCHNAVNAVLRHIVCEHTKKDEQTATSPQQPVVHTQQVVRYFPGVPVSHMHQSWSIRSHKCSLK